jgi:hypothetical protein
MDFNFNLDNAEVMGEELNKLAFDPNDYPTIEDLIDGIFTKADETPVTLSLKKLSKNGVVESDTMEKYLAAKCNSSSALKEVIKNPAAYYFYVNDKENFEEEKKDHFELGTFCHLAFLEPALFDLVITEPDHSLASTDGVNALIAFWQSAIISQQDNSKERLQRANDRFNSSGDDISKLSGKKSYLECLKEVSGLTAIKNKHKLIIDLIKRNYYMYGGGIIPAILRGAQAERSFYGVDQPTGLKVKVRPDAFNIKENIGVDAVISFKTTSAADMGKFLYDSAKFKYELSEGYYQDVMSNITGRKFNTTIMIVLQTVAPYLPAVFFWSPEDLANGKYKARYALDTIKDCMDKGLYPGFESLAESGHYGIIQMKQPGWAEKLLQPVDLED